MALMNNMREQLAKRLAADIPLRVPSMVVAQSVMASGDPMLTISVSGTAIAVAAITRRTYNGFNVVAELSASAAEGLPEHFCWMMIKDNQTQLVTAELAMIAKQLGTSAVKLGFVASPAEGSLVDASVSVEFANDARLGAVGQ